MAEGDRYKPELRRYPDDACSSFICFVEAYAKIHGGPSPQSWRTQVSPVFVQGIQMAERTENHRHTHHAIEENQEGYAFAFLNMELSRFYHSSFCKLAQGACQEIGYNGFGAAIRSENPRFRTSLTDSRLSSRPSRITKRSDATCKDE